MGIDVSLSAFGVASAIAAGTAFAALCLGFLLFFAGRASSRWLNATAYLYVQVFRNIPVLLPIYLIYFGLPLTGFFLSAAVSGGAAIALQQGAYLSEIFRGAAKTIDQRMYDGAKSIGLSSWKTFRFVTFPQVASAALRPLGSQLVLLFKDTSLLSAIGVAELMYAAKRSVEFSGEVFQPFLIAGAFYLAMTLAIDTIFWQLRRSVRWTK